MDYTFESYRESVSTGDAAVVGSGLGDSDLGSSDLYCERKLDYARGKGEVLYYPRETRTLREKQDMLRELGHDVVPLKTVAAIVGWDHYLFVMPDDREHHAKSRRRGSQRGFYWKHRHQGGRLSAETIQRAFAGAGIKEDKDLTPYVGPEALPCWAGYGTVSPLVPRDAFACPLTYGRLRAIFLLGSIEGGVEIPLGGSDDISRRSGVHIQYGDLVSVLSIQFPGKIHTVE